MKYKKVLSSIILIGVISFLGIIFFLYSFFKKTANEDFVVSINDKKEKNGISLILENIILEDKKITLNYHMTESAEKIVSVKLFNNEKELHSLTGIAESKKDNHCDEFLFNESPYKVGDTLDIHFQIYDKKDENLSHPNAFTFSVPVNKIISTTELELNKEVSMKRGDPRFIHKVLLTATKLHVFHESMNINMAFKTENGNTYDRLSTIGLGKTESVSNIPIEYGNTSGTLYISGDSLEEEQSIQITGTKSK